MHTVYFLDKTGQPDSSDDFRVWEPVGVVINTGNTLEVVIPWNRILEIWAPRYTYETHTLWI